MGCCCTIAACLAAWWRAQAGSPSAAAIRAQKSAAVIVQQVWLLPCTDFAIARMQRGMVCLFLFLVGTCCAGIMSVVMYK
jgi:hypothetical protein